MAWVLKSFRLKHLGKQSPRRREEKTGGSTLQPHHRWGALGHPPSQEPPAPRAPHCRPGGRPLPVPDGALPVDPINSASFTGRIHFQRSEKQSSLQLVTPGDLDPGTGSISKVHIFCSLSNVVRKQSLDSFMKILRRSAL